MVLQDYRFRNIEDNYNSLWEDEKLYKWSNTNNNDFVIDTPPPTISGKLHIGHVFSYCHADFIARYKRMLGDEVFYPIGFDDNGLPTERLVEKIKKVYAVNLTRSEFIAMCNEVSSELRQEFKKLFKSVGISYDWSLEYNTISKDIQALSQSSFIELYNNQNVYRKLQPVLWDPIDQTAIAQAEIEDKEQASFMNVIRFTLVDGKEVDIATTRPELLPACVAVFCHPDDGRYSELVGRDILVPIFNNKVKILSDDKVKMDKGTGLVMCCTFGDERDIYWWQKHKLETRIIVNKQGRLCNLKDDSYDNRAVSIVNKLDNLLIEESRKTMIKILSEENILIASEPIIHSVKCGERSGSPLEILLSNQWFIKILEQKSSLLEKVNQIKWYPQSMRKRIEVWIANLNWDWCISRQRYFGVPIPVWYSKRRGEEGKVLVPRSDQLPVDPLKDLPDGYEKSEVVADIDVMDTWATSSISPQFYSCNKDDSLLLSADLRSQSHEIIRSWAFYTIVRSYYHNNSIPWKNIMISGWCLADNRKKMSKSKGNIIEPKLMIENYGADVVRYWAANSRLGSDTVFSEDVLKIGKRLVTKLWNSSKFVAQFIMDYQKFEYSDVTECLDQWILSKLYKTLIIVTENFEVFEYSGALNAIEKFFWQDFCDNYLELVKYRVYANRVVNEWEKLSAVNSLSYVLQVVLLIFAPFLPYITEEIYRNLYSNNSIHNKGNWPKMASIMYSEKAEKLGDQCVGILNQVRKIKSSHNLSIKTSIKKLVIACNDSDILPKSIENDLKSACNAEIIEWNSRVDSCNDGADESFYVSVEYFS